MLDVRGYRCSGFRACSVRTCTAGVDHDLELAQLTHTTARRVGPQGASTRSGSVRSASFTVVRVGQLAVYLVWSKDACWLSSLGSMLQLEGYVTPYVFRRHQAAETLGRLTLAPSKATKRRRSPPRGSRGNLDV